MYRVHILHESYYCQNGIAFRFPLRWHRQHLRTEYDCNVRFFTSVRPELFACDVLGVTSKYFSSAWSKNEEIVYDFLRRAKSRVAHVLWFDVSDSSGTTHFRVLPFVDRYVKNQALRDRRAYQQKYYGSRPYTDFIHSRFGVEDSDPGAPHLNHVPHPDDLTKLRVGWHSGYFHYGRWGELLGAWWHRLPWMPVRFPYRWDPPSEARPMVLSCRIGTQHGRATIAASRQMLKRILEARGIPTNKLRRSAYFTELRQCLAALSPFGLGEMSLRDFECLVSGVAVVKQDMSHLETWPDLWVPGVTYLPIAWDFSDLDERLDYVASHRREVAEIARAAQERYRHALSSSEGHAEFCERFMSIVTW